MADSESSRTSPALINSNVISRAALFLKDTWDRAPCSASVDPPHEFAGDRALLLWKEWHQAQGDAERLGRVQSRLESRLFSLTDGPFLELLVPGSDLPVHVQTNKEIDRWLVGDELEDARTVAKRELSSKCEAWRIADQQVGFTCAKEAEDRALDLEETLADTLWKTPAGSSAGVIGKLHALLVKGQPANEHQEFPWPQLRSVIDDLMRMDGTARRRR